MLFKCLNDQCGREFDFLGRIDEEKTPKTVYQDIKRTILSAPCCPFCGSKEFQVIEPKEEPKK